MIRQVLLAYGQGLAINGFEAVSADKGCGTKAITTDGPSLVYVFGFESASEPQYGDNQEPLMDALFLVSTVPGVPPFLLDKRILRELPPAVPELPDLEPTDGDGFGDLGTADTEPQGDRPTLKGDPDLALPNDDTPRGRGLD